MTPFNAAAGVPEVCWSCNAASAGGHFCASCGKIQPVAASSDFFALLGLAHGTKDIVVEIPGWNRNYARETEH